MGRFLQSKRQDLQSLIGTAQDLFLVYTSSAPEASGSRYRPSYRADAGAVLYLAAGIKSHGAFGFTAPAYREVIFSPIPASYKVRVDNLPAHKLAGVETLIQARGAQVIYLPPYSPDFNPIELAWSKVKTILRRLKARTFPDLIGCSHS